ncbi:MAG: hypothetical protein GTO29_14330 [Candidatus Latescibacteria bacterium]|nr:hypothetical protein [Candidatus Latescibacterota bacterium]NIO57323.1 hypothetical protein [Candidatus Latescibacterota bacterium]
MRSLALFGEAAVTISKTIIASSTNGGAVACAGTGTATLNVCDVYGNTGGDWVDCISGQLGVDGNISESPLFCDTASGDLTLHEDSPCLPENNDSGAEVSTGVYFVRLEARGQVVTRKVVLLR